MHILRHWSIVVKEQRKEKDFGKKKANVSEQPKCSTDSISHRIELLCWRQNCIVMFGEVIEQNIVLLIYHLLGSLSHSFIHTFFFGSRSLRYLACLLDVCLSGTCFSINRLKTNEWKKKQKKKTKTEKSWNETRFVKCTKIQHVYQSNYVVYVVHSEQTVTNDSVCVFSIKYLHLRFACHCMFVALKLKIYVPLCYFLCFILFATFLHFDFSLICVWIFITNEFRQQSLFLFSFSHFSPIFFSLPFDCVKVYPLYVHSVCASRHIVDISMYL